MAHTDVQAQREGFAVALTQRLFPNLKKSDVPAYESAIELFYNWQNAVGGKRNNPLGLRIKHAKNPHQALERTAHILHTPRYSHVFSDVQGGFEAQAATVDLPAMGVTGVGMGKFPIPFTKEGDLTTPPRPSVWHDIGKTVVDTPGAAAHDAGKVAGGVGSWFGKNPVVLVIVVLVIVLVIKK